MPRPRKIEKAKNFKGAIKRLFKELNPFKVLIILGLILASLGSILSIMAPSRLSDLVDKISEGLVVNTKNLETITKNVQGSLSEDKLKESMPLILNINLDEAKVLEVMTSNISNEEKQEFQRRNA